MVVEPSDGVGFLLVRGVFSFGELVSGGSGDSVVFFGEGASVVGASVVGSGSFVVGASVVVGS